VTAVVIALMAALAFMFMLAIMNAQPIGPMIVMGSVERR
jgi:hypothetical protein